MIEFKEKRSLVPARRYEFIAFVIAVYINIKYKISRFYIGYIA